MGTTVTITRKQASLTIRKGNSANTTPSSSVPHPAPRTTTCLQACSHNDTRGLYGRLDTLPGRHCHDDCHCPFGDYSPRLLQHCDCFICLSVGSLHLLCLSLRWLHLSKFAAAACLLYVPSLVACIVRAISLLL